MTAEGVSYHASLPSVSPVTLLFPGISLRCDTLRHLRTNSISSSPGKYLLETSGALLPPGSWKDWTVSSIAATRSTYRRFGSGRVRDVAEDRPELGVIHSVLALMQLLQGMHLSPIRAKPPAFR